MRGAANSADIVAAEGSILMRMEVIHLNKFTSSM
jgi:hypothetical protein